MRTSCLGEIDPACTFKVTLTKAGDADRTDKQGNVRNQKNGNVRRTK